MAQSGLGLPGKAGVTIVITTVRTCVRGDRVSDFPVRFLFPATGTSIEGVNIPLDSMIRGCIEAAFAIGGFLDSAALGARTTRVAPLVAELERRMRVRQALVSPRITRRSVRSRDCLLRFERCGYK